MYSRGLYPLLSAPLTWVSSPIPFSLSEVALYLGGIGCMLAGAGTLARLRRNEPSRRVILGQALKTGVALSSLVLTFFFWSWGFHYARETLEIRHPELSQPPTPAAWSRTRSLLIQEIHRWQPLYEPLNESEREKEIDRSLKEVLRTYDSLTQVCTAPTKHPWSSWLLDALATSGVYSPFFAEVHVHSQLPRIALPFITAHEKAHRAGYADEGEANFIAYLTCRHSQTASLRYSGALMTYLSFARGPRFGHNEDPMTPLPTQARNDLRNILDWRNARRGALARIQGRVYDLYLRTLGVPGGIASYGRIARYVTAHESTQPPCPTH
ncbi:MAG: DUF3810 family protein [Planctomycetota bacterium]|nr:DUF3810 family protein [Planctomycetota bacterium]